MRSGGLKGQKNKYIGGAYQRGDTYWKEYILSWLLNQVKGVTYISKNYQIVTQLTWLESSQQWDSSPRRTCSL